MTDYQLLIRKQCIELVYQQTALDMIEIAEIFNVSRQTIYSITKPLTKQNENLKIIQF